MVMSRLASLGLTTKLPKLKYNDGGRGGGRGGRHCLPSVIPPPPPSDEGGGVIMQRVSDN